MTCRKVRKLIPLAAGDDLRPRPAAAVRAHVAACPACRAELESFRAALAGIRSVAKAEGVADWTESEWRSIMARAGAEAKRAGQAPVRAGQARVPAPLGRRVRAGRPHRPGRPGRALPGPVAASGRDDGSPDARSSPPGPAAQDKLTMTIVSPETGLQIVWILDRNFDWKGDRQ